jgi:hypothetical protein
MKAFISNIFSKIGKSVLKDNTHSTHRIQSYILMLPILLMVITFLIIEISSFLVCMHTGIPYSISSEILVVFGMVLTHHISVLFQKDNNLMPEIKEKKEEIKEETKEN